MGAPIPPGEYDGEHLDTDEKLKEEGWAAGLDVWSVLDKVLGDELEDSIVTNAQLWSLREAVRAEYLAELTAKGLLASRTCGRCGLTVVLADDGMFTRHEDTQGNYCPGSHTMKCGDPNDCRCTHGCDIP